MSEFDPKAMAGQPTAPDYGPPMATMLADEAMLQRSLLLERIITVAERMAERIVRIEVIGRGASDLEVNRGAVKWAVIERLMQTVAAPGGKAMSFSQASSTEGLGQDAAYRDYLRHQADTERTLERLKYEQSLDALNYRALIATLESLHV